MRDEQVPQHSGRVLAGHSKAVYAQGADGRLHTVSSSGWEAEEIVNLQAGDDLRRLAEEARAQALAGTVSPLAFHMYQARMDVALLSQTTGLWQWRIRRHLRPTVFAQLSPQILARYAAAMGISVSRLQALDPA